MSATLYDLPDEVLTFVFETYVLDLDCSPWDLTWISKRLRVVAFSSPQIWTRLQIKHASASDLTWNGRNKSHLICRSATALRMVLDQSINASLDIIIAELDMDMAIELAKEQARWRSITFQDANSVRSRDVFKWLFSQANTPIQLKEVTFYCLVNVVHIQQWLNTIQPLSLELKYSDKISNLDGMVWFKRLRKLTIGRIWTNAEETYLREILYETAPQLTHLNISSVRYQGSIILEMPIEFPSLVALDAVCIRRWWNFMAPNLRKFSFYPKDFASIASRPTYPRLEELTFTPNARQGLSGCSLSAAMLNTLTLKNIQTGQSLTDIFVFGLLPSRMKVLHIEASTFPYTNLVAILRSLHYIEELRLSAVRFPSEFILKLEWTGADTLCPRLQRLVCNLRSFPEMAPSHFEHVFKNLADSRRLGDVYLEVLRVLWPKPWDGSPAEFV